MSLALTLTVVVIGQQGDTGITASGLFARCWVWDILSDTAKRTMYFIEVAAMVL
jgi:urea transport system permease protein